MAQSDTQQDHLRQRAGCAAGGAKRCSHERHESQHIFTRPVEKNPSSKLRRSELYEPCVFVHIDRLNSYTVFEKNQESQRHRQNPRGACENAPSGPVHIYGDQLTDPRAVPNELLLIRAERGVVPRPAERLRLPPSFQVLLPRVPLLAKMERAELLRFRRKPRTTRFFRPSR